MRFLFKIPVLQRLSFPIRMWESFPLNFRLIQTTWVWNLAPETFQTEGLGAIWQDAALQNAMAFADAPWSSCLREPIPPQTILSAEHEAHISLSITSAEPGCMWRQWERFRSGGEWSLLFPLFTPLRRRSPSPMCFTLEIWSQVGADCSRAGGICNAITFLMSRPSVEPKVIACVFFLA